MSVSFLFGPCPCQEGPVLSRRPRAVRVTSLSLSPARCCRLKRAFARLRFPASLGAVSGVCLGWGQSCCLQDMEWGSGWSWWQPQCLFCPLQPGQGMPAPGLVPDPLWQCLQQSQTRKLPADTRVCKRKQSSKDRVSCPCSCLSCVGECMKLRSPASRAGCPGTRHVGKLVLVAWET